MDRTLESQIEQDCLRVLFQFAHALDAGDSEKVASLFAADGVWLRQGVELRGRDKIREAVGKRPKNVVTCHHFLNTVITVKDADKAEGRSYYAVYRYEGPEELARGPLPLAGPERVGEYLDHFVRTADGWRISFNAAKRVFERR